MRTQIKRFALIGFLFSSSASIASFPDIFQYDDPAQCTGIHVTLHGQDKEGSEWVTRNVTNGDFAILASLYQNPVVMANFGDGSLRTAEQIKGRIALWTGRSQNGHPHAGLIIEKAEDHSPIGMMVAGVGDGVGVSEIARMILPEFQGSGIGTSAMRALVQTWAPAVRQLGLQEENLLLRGKFRCFSDSELKQLYVTSSPANVGSWKSQVRAGFKRKGVSAELPLIDLSNLELHNYGELEVSFSELFDPAKNNEPLLVNTLYPMIDHEGNERTISMHPDYKKPKFHFEYDLTK
jgi:RimJ/RimL family protein N-acetyltransferase